MKRNNVEARDAFVAVNCDFDVIGLADLLDGKVISDCACPIPDEVVDASQRFCLSQETVEQIIDGFLTNVSEYFP